MYTLSHGLIGIVWYGWAAVAPFGCTAVAASLHRGWLDQRQESNGSEVRKDIGEDVKEKEGRKVETKEEVKKEEVERGISGSVSEGL